MDPKIDASGHESKRKHTEECHCDCYRLFEMCRKRHIVRNLRTAYVQSETKIQSITETHKYWLRVFLGKVFEVQSDRRTSDGVEVSCVG